jgi:hypothetical protein
VTHEKVNEVDVYVGFFYHINLQLTFKQFSHFNFRKFEQYSMLAANMTHRREVERQNKRRRIREQVGISSAVKPLKEQIGKFLENCFLICPLLLAF